MELNTEALIRDLATVLAGASQPHAVIGTPARLALRRMQDVLGWADGESRKGIGERLAAALAPGAPSLLTWPQDADEPDAPDAYEDFREWFAPRWTGPGSVTAGDACRKFTSTSLETILAWWKRYLAEGGA